MNNVHVAIRSFFHFWRSNLAIALGVAAATAVLSGALIVGDSMRGSLRDLTIDRLAGIDEIYRGEGFFREALLDEIRQSQSFRDFYSQAAGAIMLPNSSAESEQGDKKFQAVGVSLFGCDAEFWKFNDAGARPTRLPVGDEVIINETLARDLNIDAAGSAMIAVRLPLLGRVPADSALGEKEKLVEYKGELKVIEILPDQGLGRFSMYPTQLPPKNVFMSLELMQDLLGPTELKNKSDKRQINVVFLGTENHRQTPTKEQTDSLRKSIRPSLADFDFRVERVQQKFKSPEGDEQTVFDYYSLSSDKMIMSETASRLAEQAFPDAQPVMTYLANRMSVKGGEQNVRPIPFSMISAIEFGDRFAPQANDNSPINKLGENEIVLNLWAAEKLGAKIGDTIEVFYFEPETTDGNEVEAAVELKLVAIADLKTPSREFEIDLAQNEVIAPPFDERPTLANDPHLTPFVPGLTDAVSIDQWDLPFDTPGIEAEDNQYWKFFRTTPKAFVSLAMGRKLWGSRFGNVTSMRIPIEGRNSEQVQQQFVNEIEVSDETLGFELISIKRQGLRASGGGIPFTGGATPFDALFLALSMFVIFSALLLVSILFQLSLQQRSNEIGLFSAVGLTYQTITKIWSLEMIIVCVTGAVLGVGLGYAYAALMLLGLRTWWVGAISTPFVHLHVGWLSPAIGLIAGTLVCVLTIRWAIRKTRTNSVRNLLSGKIETPAKLRQTKSGVGIFKVFCGVLVVIALVLSIVASQLSGESQAGAFLGGGFCLLSAMLLSIWSFLRRPGMGKSAAGLNLTRLALHSAGRNPLRSTLTIGLVAVASFLIVSISSFRLQPTREGTADFGWVVTTQQPIFEDLNEPKVQDKLLGVSLESSSKVLPFRYKSGEDASCNNPFQSTQPQVLGVTKKLIRHFDDENVQSFSWSANAAETDDAKKNPWRLLAEKTDLSKSDAAIPVVIDKNTAWYSLKVYTVGSEFSVKFDNGREAKFKLAGLLNNSILQGSLLISEADFTQLFPDSAGYRYFLMDLSKAGDLKDPEDVIVRNELVDYGVQLQNAEELLAGFLAVQNTYLSTFQSLGALGLLLGTFGLAAVQLRSVFERKQELALMRAMGFVQSRLGKFVLLETIVLLTAGLLIGILSAALVTLPHAWISRLSIPWLELMMMFAAIFLVGLITSWTASRWIAKQPILSALRN